MTDMKCTVQLDETARQVCKLFDYTFDGESKFTIPDPRPIPEKFGIGLVVGPSGSGKSTLLRQYFGEPSAPRWQKDKAIVSHFRDAKEAYERLGAVGLNSIPSWMRPYHVLSTGEKFRADLARQVGDGAIIDEFTSVVDRNVAKSCAAALRRHVTNAALQNIVIASCHYDIIEWLQPEWIFDTSTGHRAGRRLERRPSINLRIEPCTADEWKSFGVHHYMNTTMNKAARCWLASWDLTRVGFVSALSFPNQYLKNAWREHRTVVLPDFQGLGIGVAISNAVANIFVGEGCRYFSKTAHPRFGEYRNNSVLWRATSKNGRDRQDYSPWITTKEDKHKKQHANRVCYSHEFVGYGAIR